MTKYRIILTYIVFGCPPHRVKAESLSVLFIKPIDVGSANGELVGGVLGVVGWMWVWVGMVQMS